MFQPICCERVEIELGDYLDGQLPRALRMRIDSHLAACPECWREVHTLRHTITCLSDLPRRPMPPDVKDSIFRARSDDSTHAPSEFASGRLPVTQRS